MLCRVGWWDAFRSFCCQYYCWVSLILMVMVRHASCQCSFPAIFNFGDSNSDSGGLTAAFPPLGPPFGETFFTHPAGRYSDGRIAIDFITEAFGYPFLSPYLQSVGSNYYRGANFATGGSSVLRPPSSFSSSGVSPFYLQMQLNQFREFKNRVATFGPKETLPNDAFFNQALYIMEIGQNDISSNLGQLGFEGIKSIFPQVVDGIGNGLKFLYGIGSRTLMVVNIGPLGCYPGNLYYYGASQTLDGVGCITTLNEDISYFNQLLKAKVGEAQQELHDASIIYVDSFSIKYDLFSNYSLYGFDHAFQACCGGGGEYNFNPSLTCGSSTTTNGSVSTAGSCSDPSKYISWDGVHFTEAAHKYIATQILSGKYFSPSAQLCQ